MDKEMDVLLSEKELNIGGKKIIVKRLALLDTIRLASHISDIVSIVLNSSDAVSNAFNKVAYSGNPEIENETEDTINGIRVTGLIEIFGILGDDGTSLLKDLIVKSTNLTEEDVEDIDCIDGIDLISEIFEVNKGFFEKLSNKLKEKLAKPKKKSKKDK